MMHGHLLASVDVETTGVVSGYHEIVQIAVVPLDDDLRPFDQVAPFYTNVRPDHPERIDEGSWQIHGLSLDDLTDSAPSQGRAADLFMEWFEALKLPAGRKLVPLAHNWTFEYGFLKAWLGQKTLEHIFHFHPRDAMVYALAIGDRMALAGRAAPFESVSLSGLCRAFNVNNPKPHDALHDALAEAEVYRAMLTQEGPQWLASSP
jgi:DNA polymerase III epsilon subunit-like protein